MTLVEQPQLPLFGVRRSTRARRARLTLTDEGQPLVVLPARAPHALAAEMVARHADWLARHQRRIQAEQRALAARPRLGAGRTLSVAGSEHLILVEPAVAGRSSVRRTDGAPPAIVVRPAADAVLSVPALLEAWLRKEARRVIEDAVARRAREMGLEPRSVSIRDQRTRWGSASARGTLSFSWRLVLCPPAVLDYVVVHELAHLGWRGHGPRFWALVRRYVPAAEEHRRWLRANHRALRAALEEGAA